MIQVKSTRAINDDLRELQEKGYSILDIKVCSISKKDLVLIVYDTNDMIEDIKCEEGKLKWDAKGNLGISGLKSQLSEEIDRYFR